jgi:hypothetical protein
MCPETPRMQDFALFTLQLLGALAARRPKFFSLASLAVLRLLFQNSPPTFESPGVSAKTGIQTYLLQI